jgi:ferredoxin/truncated hemoglobin YjbI
MATIHYQGQSYECREDETLLDAMLRQGVDFPFSCRGGICRVCMHRAESGAVPAAALKGLDETQREQGLFLPCRCRPTEDMHIATVTQAVTAQKKEAESTKPEPDLELWQALGDGALMSEILEDFYSQAFADERLAPFFHGVTQRRAMEKQFLFLRQQITGEKVYFGDRPRNAHHWMVISNELFDYREQLMVETLRRHGLAEPMVKRWVAIENRFRADIVKDEPWKRKIGDVELPLDGYEETVLDVGSLCDGCGSEVKAGVTVRYHLRLGSIYCPTCM